VTLTAVRSLGTRPRRFLCSISSAGHFVATFRLDKHPWLGHSPSLENTSLDYRGRA
jgi:hypothetical protein